MWPSLLPFFFSIDRPQTARLLKIVVIRSSIEPHACHVVINPATSWGFSLLLNASVVVADHRHFEVRPDG
jgi:hypothetical protein